MYCREIHKNQYKRRELPHRDIPEVMQSLTYRLWDSIPQIEIVKIRNLLDNSRYDIQDFKLRYLTEQCLNSGFGSGLLKYPEIATIVLRDWLEGEGEAYELLEWVIMPTHVHLLFRPHSGYSLGDIVRYWKSHSSQLIQKTELYRNIIRNYPKDMQHSVWSIEYYDRQIRSNGHFSNMKKYIYNNPIGLTWNGQKIESPEQWPFSSASDGWQSYIN